MQTLTKKKAGGENPNRAVQEWPQLAARCFSGMEPCTLTQHMYYSALRGSIN